MKYTLEQCLEVQKQVDASIKHNGEYMPWLAGIKEVIEMCDHLAMIDTWKKQPEPDMKQAFMELVDVFAFAMSSKEGCEKINIGFIDDYVKEDDFILSWELRCLFTDLSNSYFNHSIACIIRIAVHFFDKTRQDIFYYYLGKKTLTQFRQDNGYKDGTYIKMWGNREDNEFLTDALEKGIEIEEIPSYLKENYERLVIAKSEVE